MNGSLPVPMGAFEVFFLGTRIFSKIQSSVWPNPAMVAKRCLRAYMEFHGTGNIEQFETTTIDKRHLSRNETESFSKASLKSPKRSLQASKENSSGTQRAPWPKVPLPSFLARAKEAKAEATLCEPAQELSAVSFNSAAPGH